MKTWFAGASIRRKLTIVIALTTTFALLLAAAGLGTYENATSRRTLVRRVTTLADIVGRNSTAALTFKDPAAATDVLSALAAEPSVESAALYDAEQRIFVTYNGRLSAEPPASPGADGDRFDGNSLTVVRPIVLAGERAGTVYIRSSLAELTLRMYVFVAVMIAVVFGCVVIALFVSAGLQRFVSKPILDLARTARRITSDKNYALRAAPAGRDEVGVLVEDFNRMLTEIEQQNQRLRQHQADLESEVARRTSDLVSSNGQLVASMRRVETHADQIAQLTALSQLLQSCNTTEEVFGVVRQTMVKILPSASGVLGILNASGSLVETMASWGDAPPTQTVWPPNDCWAFRRGRPHVVVDQASPLRCLHTTAAEGRLTMCVPMMAQGDNLGVLQFDMPKGDADDALDDTGAAQSTRARLAVALAEHMGLALANLRLKDALRNQSIIDPLTGLFNRRYLDQILERECRRAVRSGRPLSVLMIDVDHFKSINDMCGHDGGDAVLRDLASLLRRDFRGDDIACRYGGEEFVLLLAEASLEAARSRAEELRLTVQRLPVRHRSQTVGSITISIGLASLPDHGMTPETLIAAADRALYEAKTSGRNRTVNAPALTQPVTS